MLLNKKAFLVGVLVFCLALPALAYFSLPPLPPSDKYGDVVMNRVSSNKGEMAVVFSHWSHRTRYSCRVCHFELSFAMVAGQTEVSEEENRDGNFCGACHNGTQVFGHTEAHCDKCHTGPQVDRRYAFAALQDKLRKLPRTDFGNRIDWTLAIQSGQIAPSYSLFKAEEKPMAFDKRLDLAAEWNWVPPAIFDHATHVPWLDCSNCHPDIFNIKKKTTKHFSMEFILKKKFCGVCHFSVALPIDDCQACHPGMNRRN